MMHKSILVLLLFTVCLGFSQDMLNEWENPCVLDCNKDSGRASFVIYHNEVSARRTTPENFKVYQHIDFKQRGVVRDDSWGALPHEPYRLVSKKYRYSCQLKPLY